MGEANRYPFRLIQQFIGKMGFVQEIVLAQQPRSGVFMLTKMATDQSEVSGETWRQKQFPFGGT